MPARLQIFGCSLRSAEGREAWCLLQDWKLLQQGEVGPSPQAVPLLWAGMGAVSTGFLCHPCFRLSLAPEDAAEPLWPQALSMPLTKESALFPIPGHVLYCWDKTFQA